MAIVRASTIDEWSSLVAEAFVPLVVEPTAAPFAASMDTRKAHLGALTLVRHTPCSALRTDRLIDGSSEDIFLFSLQLAGRNTVSQEGRDTVVTAGRAVFYQSRKPYELHCPDSGTELVMHAPRSWLGLNSSQLDNLSARTVEITGTALNSYAAYVTSHFAGDSVVDDHVIRLATEHVRHGVRQLLGLPATMPSRSALLSSMRAFIATNLDDPSLGVSMLARRHKVSVRSVHNVFAAIDTSPATYVRQQRLKRAGCLLLDSDLPVSDVASSVGMTDAGTLTRALRRSTGLTPTEIRRAASRRTH